MAKKNPGGKENTFDETDNNYYSESQERERRKWREKARQRGGATPGFTDESADNQMAENARSRAEHGVGRDINLPNESGRRDERLTEIDLLEEMMKRAVLQSRKK